MNFRLLLLSAFCLLSFTISLSSQKELTNKLIWASNEFRTEYVSGLNSMKDGEHYTSLDYSKEGNEINKYSYRTGEKIETLVSSADLEGIDAINDYEFSSDENQLLLASEMEGIYRHSSKSNYFIYDLATKKLKPLTDHQLGKQRLADFSPNGRKVAFVRNNNLFVKDLTDDSERRLTEDGKYNEVINGATDWVNEEEFGFDKGFEWSPEGNYIAFYRFDESEVKEFDMATYGNLYPGEYRFKYPKAGETNSKVEIYIADLQNKKNLKVDLGSETDIYIPRIKWSKRTGDLTVMRLNRHQNHLEFLSANVLSTRSHIITPIKYYDETSETYIEINDNLIFIDERKFLWNSDKDGYNHIYLFDTKGNLLKQITRGNWDVIDFLGYDPLTNRVFYTSSQEGATEKHVYAANLKGSSPKRMSSKAGYNEASFSKGFKFFINYHSDANTPYNISLHDSRGKKIRTLKDNQNLVETIRDYNFQPKEFFSFTTSQNTELNGWMIKPPKFQPGQKYPVVLAIYGGPGHNTVLNSWGGRNLYWHQMLAQQGFIVVSVDNRGTLYRGRDFKNSTYLQLGKLETEDMIETAKYLQTQKYVDSERIGIQGWSYGGYLSSLCMTKGAEYFKVGIAVAPVTNWRFYDTIYTERFMRTPQENADGYDDNSPINHVDKLEGAYLLVHGSGDDNVHYQNTMEMINALVAADKQFELFIYPDRNHGIYGGNTRKHLFDKMTTFLKENL